MDRLLPLNLLTLLADVRSVSSLTLTQLIFITISLESSCYKDKNRNTKKRGHDEERFKMSELVRASLSIERSLMERFDVWVEGSGHSNRSEAMRDLIRAKLSEEALERGEGEVIASVTLLYDHHARRLSRQIEERGHEHHGLVLSSMHVHLSERLCLELIVLRGALDELRALADHLIGLEGVLHGQAFYSSTEALFDEPSPDDPSHQAQGDA